MCCALTRVTTTVRERTYRWPRTRPYPEPSRPSAAFFPCRSSADCITITSGSDLRQPQAAGRSDNCGTGLGWLSVYPIGTPAGVSARSHRNVPPCYYRCPASVPWFATYLAEKDADQVSGDL